MSAIEDMIERYRGTVHREAISNGHYTDHFVETLAKEVVKLSETVTELSFIDVEARIYLENVKKELKSDIS